MEIGITLTIVFAVLKWVGVIDWSWVWVLSPLWIGAAIMGIMFAAGGAVTFFMSRRERKMVTRNRRELGGSNPIVEGEVRKQETFRSKKRIAFCILGVALAIVANIQSDIGFELDPVNWTVHDDIAMFLLFLGLYFVIQGSYWWAREKGRSGWWCLMGLLAPIGYIVLMNLKDKRLLRDKDMEPISGAVNYCPHCGYKLNEVSNYCPNCGREVV
jgi:hypothetical protein